MFIVCSSILVQAFHFPNPIEGDPDPSTDIHNAHQQCCCVIHWNCEWNKHVSLAFPFDHMLALLRLKMSITHYPLPITNRNKYQIPRVSVVNANQCHLKWNKKMFCWARDSCHCSSSQCICSLTFPMSRRFLRTTYLEPLAMFVASI